MKITCSREQETLLFAAEELTKYLAKMDAAFNTMEALIRWLFENEAYFGRHLDIYLLNLRVVRVTVIRMRRKLGLPDTVQLEEK